MTSQSQGDGVEPCVSVILPVHSGVEAAHFDRALASLATQTRLPDETVIVLDGPVNQQMTATIERYKHRLPGLTIKSLPVNMGPGVANDVGLRTASCEWIAKADADDVNMPNRLERQLAFVALHGVDVCGAAMAEFADSENRVTGIRRNPLHHGEISRVMRMNNPVNHPASMYRRELALDAGGYPDMRFGEDYVLFARLMAQGAVFANMPDVLVRFRASDAMYRRRGINSIGRAEWQLQAHLRSAGITSGPRRLINLVIRIGFSSMPHSLRHRLHRRVFTSPASEYP